MTLDEEHLDRAWPLMAAGKAASVSGFVQHAVSVSLDDVAGWGAMLAEPLRQTGGDLQPFWRRRHSVTGEMQRSDHPVTPLRVHAV